MTPITTHETAVGRKKTERKKRQPRRWRVDQERDGERQRDRDRDREHEQRVVLSTCMNSGLWKSRGYVGEADPLRAEPVPVA